MVGGNSRRGGEEHGGVHGVSVSRQARDRKVWATISSRMSHHVGQMDPRTVAQLTV